MCQKGRIYIFLYDKETNRQQTNKQTNAALDEGRNCENSNNNTVNGERYKSPTDIRTHMHTVYTVHTWEIAQSCLQPKEHRQQQ